MAWAACDREVMVNVRNKAKRNASRWEYRQFIKDSAKRARRQHDRRIIQEQSEG